MHSSCLPAAGVERGGPARAAGFLRWSGFCPGARHAGCACRRSTPR
ncbi:hypothetical protein ACFPM0_25000 [Pseudonocardia sulfidoxydans]